MLFPNRDFLRYDESADEDFYSQARIVTHIDDAAIAAVTQLYREFLPPGGEILDLMSSWISHLPPEVKFSRVVGLGMNREELNANPRLDERVVQNLNENSRLTFADATFDGATCCVSVQYLTKPVEVLRDLARTLTPDAPCIITFSNRCFPTKAVLAWQRHDDRGHAILVQSYFEAAGNWQNIEAFDCTPPQNRNGRGDPLLAVIARRA